MKAHRLWQFLHDAHRRLRRSQLLCAALQSLGWLLIAILIAIVLDAIAGFDAPGLIALDLCLAASVLAVAASLLHLRWRLRLDPQRLASLVEHRLGLARSRLINAVELAGDASSATSASLRSHAVLLGDELASRLDAQALVDPRPIQKAAKTLALMLAGTLAAFALMPSVFLAVVPRLLAPTADLPPFTRLTFDVQISPDRLHAGHPADILARISGPSLPRDADVVFIHDDSTRHALPMISLTAPTANTSADEAARFLLHLDRVDRPRRFYITTPHGRSRTYELPVLMTPLFEKTLVLYDYPDYTGWPDAQEPLRDAGLRTLVGTRITLTIISNVPLRSGTLTIEPQADSPHAPTTSAAPIQSIHLTPTPGDPRSIQGSFVLNTSGSFSIHLTGVDGTPSEQPLQGRLVAIPDQPPQVAITYPARYALVPEGWVVDVHVEATDDIGLSRVILHQSIDGKASLGTSLPRDAANPRRLRAVHRLDLNYLNARAGDVIRYFATAYDNHPPPAQSADSDVHLIRVITMEEYFRLAQQRQLSNDLTAQAQRLANLIQQQRSLAQRLEPYRDINQASAEDRPLIESLAHEQAQLQRELADVQQRLRELAALARDDLPRMSASAEQLASTIDRMQVSRDQADAHKHAQEGRADSAYRSADAAADKLESLLSESQHTMGLPAPNGLDHPLSLTRPLSGQTPAQMPGGQMAGSLDPLSKGPAGFRGEGMQGFASTAALIGPTLPSASPSSADASSNSSALPGQGEGSGSGLSPDSEDWASPESLTPDPAARELSATALQGVPAPFREAAHAYYERIAQENR